MIPILVHRLFTFIGTSGGMERLGGISYRQKYCQQVYAARQRVYQNWYPTILLDTTIDSS